MQKSIIRIRIDLRIGNTNKFKELIRIHVFESLWRKIEIQYKEKDQQKSEILTRTDFAKKIVYFVLKHIDKNSFYNFQKSI